MTRAERKILRWLREGATIWAPAGARLAWVVLPAGSAPDHARVRASTMHRLAERDLVVNHTAGTEFADNNWKLPAPRAPDAEDAIQAGLDAEPGDWQARLVLADLLDERGDPRGPGYRALGRHRVWPHHCRDVLNLDTWAYHNGRGPTGASARPMADAHRLPSQRWLDLTQDEEYRTLGRKMDGYKTRNTVLSSCVAPSRRWLEDCAARAFAGLEPAERRALLEGPP